MGGSEGKRGRSSKVAKKKQEATASDSGGAPEKPRMQVWFYECAECGKSLSHEDHSRVHGFATAHVIRHSIHPGH